MNFYVASKLYTGQGCIQSNKDEILGLGKKCYIVCGGSGARKSGALTAITELLNSSEVEWKVFDAITPNPPLELCLQAGREANCFGADYIIGIGGGSALDAAKVTGVAAANPFLDETGFYAKDWVNVPLPVALVGTTAGTGSEVTDVAVVTDSRLRKHSIHDERLFSSVSFGDPQFTMSLSKAVTLSTGVDALAHCIESAFSKKSNDISRAFSIRGVAILMDALQQAVDNQYPLNIELREKLYNASILGGYAISVTGTVFPHNVGYYLSENYGVPHGTACAMLLPELIRRMMLQCKDYASVFFDSCGTDAGKVIELIEKTLPESSISLTADEIDSALPRWNNNNSVNNTMCSVSIDEIRDILTHLGNK